MYKYFVAKEMSICMQLMSLGQILSTLLQSMLKQSANVPCVLWILEFRELQLHSNFQCIFVDQLYVHVHMLTLYCIYVIQCKPFHQSA